ncbi:TadE family type IV pilus minor pilin [Rathayibacter sp. YIM 133350]|uniref:TadE family type IV pilus minor pilin n=1 Tax=Rathayibacter sp. YIM 133350 TaxID=3131992 RepID=UPI00307DF648
MTAELAVALPTVVLVLAACLAAVQIVSVQVRVTDAAAQVARALSRGDAAAAASALAAGAVAGATVTVDHGGGLVCARVQAPAARGSPLAGVQVAARSCALDGGR